MTEKVNPLADFERDLDVHIDSLTDDGQREQLRIAQREEKWKQKRIGKITSSNFPKILKFTKTGRIASKIGIDYLLEILHQKETGEDTPQVFAKAMQWGNDYEAEAHEYYRKVSGIDMLSGTYGFEDILFIDNIIEGIGDSPDGRTADGKGTAEYKCPYIGANHLRNCALTSFNDTNVYFWQVMGHMLDPKIEWCDFVSFDPRYPDGHPHKIKILRTYRKDVLPRIEFLKKYLENYVSVIKTGSVEEILKL